MAEKQTLTEFMALTGETAPVKTEAEIRSDSFLAEKKAKEENTFSDLYTAGLENNHTVTNLMQLSRMNGHEVDPDYEMDPERLVKDLEERGIPVEWMDEFDDVLSEQHYQAKLAVYGERAANDQKLNATGLRGFTANTLSMLSDPVAFAADSLAAPIGGAGKARKLYRMGRAALGAGATNALVGSLQGMVDPDYGAGDMLVDFTAGAGLGFLIDGGGTLLRKGERKELFDSFNRWAQGVSPSSFGRDSASAARVGGSRVDTVHVQTALGEGRVKGAREVVEDLEDDLGQLSSAVGKRVRIDAMRHVDAQGEAGRTLMRLLHSDPVGVKDGAVNATGAVERANNVRGLWTRMWRVGEDGDAGWEGALREFFKGRGQSGVKGWWNRQFSLAGREEFSRAVGEAALTGAKHADPAVNRAVDVLKQTMSRVWDDGVKAGVNGMKAGGGLMDYAMPRVLRNDLWQFIKDLGGSDTRALEEPLTEGFKQAIRGGRTEHGLPIDEETTEKVAKAYVSRIMGAKSDAMGGIDRMTELRLDYLEDVLEEAGVKQGEIDEILAKFVPEKTKEGAVPTERLKQRLPLDMNVRIKMENGREVKLTDFFDTHAERVTDNYIREMGGHVALAQTGFKTWREVDGLITQLHQVEKQLDDKGAKVSRMMLRNILGRPMVESEAGDFARAARMVQDANFLSSMGSVLFSMLAENGKILGTTGYRAAMKQIPELGKVMKQALNGTLDDETARQMASLWGTGISMLKNQVSLRAEDYNIPGFTDGVMGKVDRTSQRLKRFQTMMSGLGPVTDMQQIFFGRSMLQRFYDDAQSGGLSKALRGRFKDYGLKDSEIDKLMVHFKGAEAKNGVLTNPKLDEMDEKLALRFGEAMNRATRHVIQDLDAGAVPEWMHGPTAKLLMQFRTFTLGGYARHTLHGIAKHDSIAAVGFASSMAFAMAGYIGMAYVNYGADKERLKQMLTTDAIIKNSFARASDSSIIPMIIDSTLTALGEEKIFAYARSTGLGTDFVTGNPTVNTINRIGQVGMIPTNALRTDREVTKEQVKAAMALVAANRLPGLLNLQHMVADEFPSAQEIDQD